MIEKAHFQQLGVRELDQVTHVLSLGIEQNRSVRIDDGRVVRAEREAEGRCVGDFLLRERVRSAAQHLGNDLRLTGPEHRGVAGLGERRHVKDRIVFDEFSDVGAGGRVA